MKQGGASSRNAGFTIVETLIVLAVTGAMILSVMGLLSGRQGETEFQQATNDLVTEFQDIARQVSVGYYPGLIGETCSVDVATHSFNFSSGVAAQGTNSGCIFLGKVIQLGLQANGQVVPSDGSLNEQAAIYTIAGCQFAQCKESADPTALVSASLSDAEPQAINTTELPTATSWYGLEGGFMTKWMCYYTVAPPANPQCTDHNANSTRAFGVLQSFASYSVCNTGGIGGLCSGSSHATLYGVQDGTTQNVSMDAMLTDLTSTYNALTGKYDSKLEPAQTVVVCFGSGTVNKSDLVTIGADTSSVTSKVFNGGNCGV